MYLALRPSTPRSFTDFPIGSYLLSMDGKVLLKTAPTIAFSFNGRCLADVCPDQQFVDCAEGEPACSFCWRRWFHFTPGEIVMLSCGKSIGSGDVYGMIMDYDYSNFGPGYQVRTLVGRKTANLTCCMIENVPPLAQLALCVVE